MNRLATCVWVVLALAASAPAAAQERAVMGRVVNGATTAGVSEATVTLRARSGTPSSRDVLTDSSGNFVFLGVADGTYDLMADKPGHLFGTLGQRNPKERGRFLTVGPAETLADLRIPLWKLARISGLVTNEHGEPVVGRPVHVMVRNTFAGRSGWSPQSSGVTTDDRGAYTLQGLYDGDHLVYLPASNSAIETDGKSFGYPMVIYPAAATPAAATPIPLEFGDERTGIDFRIQPARVYRVSGMVWGQSTRTVVRLLLVDDATEIELGIARTDTGGSFTFPAVPPGVYRVGVALQAKGASSPSFVAVGDPDPAFSTRQRQATLSVPVIVSEEDVLSVNIGSNPSYPVSGTVRFVGATPPAESVKRSVSLTVSSVDGRTIGWPRPTETGAFEFSAPAGSYFVRPIAPPDGWVLESVMVGGRDAMDAPFVITDAPISALVVTMTDKISVVSGTVRATDGRSLAATGDSATVLFFPVAQTLWVDIGAFAPRFGRTTVSSNGTFTMRGLPTGDYFAVAVAEVGAWTWQSRERLLELSRGATRVRVAADDKPVLSLQVIAGR